MLKPGRREVFSMFIRSPNFSERGTSREVAMLTLIFEYFLLTVAEQGVVSQSACSSIGEQIQ